MEAATSSESIPVRLHSRESRVNVGIRATLSSGRKDQIVLLRDISLHGAGIEGARKIEIHGEVTVRFPLKVNGRRIVVEARAEVRHSRRGEGAVGIRFLRLPFEAQDAISQFLAH